MKEYIATGYISLETGFSLAQFKHLHQKTVWDEGAAPPPKSKFLGISRASEVFFEPETKRYKAYVKAVYGRWF